MDLRRTLAICIALEIRMQLWPNSGAKHYELKESKVKYFSNLRSMMQDGDVPSMEGMFVFSEIYMFKPNPNVIEFGGKDFGR